MPDETSPAADQRPVNTRPGVEGRPRPTPVARPKITLEQLEKIIARIEASSSLPDDAKHQIIQLIAAIYGFKLN